ncbi:hypothetical protein Tco_0034125 [Tanacetum coccineum]
MTKTKSFNKNTKHKALYHALIESFLEDKDVMDKGVANKSKKRKLDDADRNEGPLAGSKQGLKRKKTSKDVETSKKAKLTETSKGTTKSQPKSFDKSAQAEETMFEAGDTQVPQNLGDDMGINDETPVVNDDPKDWFKKLKRPFTPDPEWNKCKTFDNKPTQKWIRPAYKILKGTCRSYVKLEYNMEECYKALNDQLDWYNPEDQQLYTFMEGDFPRLYLNDGEDMLLLVVQNRLFNIKGEDIVHLAAALRMFTRHIVIQKRVEDLQLGVESY